MSTLHHFPKWMVDERFEITHAPSITLAPFTVVLFDRVQGRHYGHGHSIADAAKAALKKREKITADDTDRTDKKAAPSESSPKAFGVQIP